MYVRYKLRKTQDLVTPKGPVFSSSKTIACDIDGSVIKFKAPKHRPQHSNHEPIIPKHSYKLDEMIFRSSYSEGFSVSDNWEKFELFHRTWAFYGPWFTGTVAELEMYISMIKPVNYDNENFSLFHPRAFEKIIGDFLTNDFSTFKSVSMGGKHHYIAPVNWKPLNNLPVVAVRLEVVADVTVINRTNRYFIFFPITDKVMTCIQFIPSQLLALSQEELDKRVNRSSMLELMENIINSIDLKLSTQAQAQQQAALAGLDDTSLIKEFQPLKWASFEQLNKLKELDK
ncbi:MAG: hypothetical protein QM500_21745 [Methylococcales bacterium]